MTKRSWLGSGASMLSACVGAAAVGYGACAAAAWFRYGHVRPATGQERDELLDRFLPDYDVVERHSIRVNAAAADTMIAARDQDLLAHPLTRSIFRMRELVLGATPDGRSRPRGLLASTLSLGWGVLAEVPDREIVVGAVTRPWEGNVEFRAVPPEEFAGFSQPGIVKIAWTLRADPLADGTSIFRTETRAAATDADARARFRRYWAFASPGIGLIRRLSLAPLKRAAEGQGPAAPIRVAAGNTDAGLAAR